MSSPFAKLRHHGDHSGRQKAAPPVPVSTRPVVDGTSARMPNGPQGVLAVAASPFPPEPVKNVQCGFCHVMGLSSDIPGIGGGEYRCFDIPACTQRYIDGAQAVPMPEPALPVLPEAQEAALERFNAASDEQDAREAGAAPEDGVDAHCDWCHAPLVKAGDAWRHADRDTAALAGCPETEDPAPVAEPEAEPRAEDEGPAPAAEEPLVPVAEVPAEPVQEPQEDSEGEQA